MSSDKKELSSVEPSSTRPSPKKLNVKRQLSVRASTTKRPKKLLRKTLKRVNKIVMPENKLVSTGVRFRGKK